MPRPKRSKIIPSAIPAKTTTKAIVKSRTRDTSTAVAPKRSRTLTETAEHDANEHHAPATTTISTRASRRDIRPESLTIADGTDTLMSGALPIVDTSQQTVDVHTPARHSLKKARAASGSNRSSGKKPSPSVVASALARSPAQGITNVFEDTETTGFEDMTFSLMHSDSIDHGTHPPSAIKIGATPAHEASILALTNFKRRARQPSLLRMVQQTDDVEDSVVDRSRDYEELDLELMVPDAESTPLNFGRSDLEDESRNDSGTQISSSGSRGVKRKLSPVIQVPRSSPPFNPSSGGDVESERSLSPSLPEIFPSREELVEQTQDYQETLSETYAPPKSSSPLVEAQAPAHPAQSRARRGRPARIIVDTKSDVDDNKTPVKAKRCIASKAQRTISTAQLKGLLPRRRNRKRFDYDEYGLESSEMTQMDSDQDELQMPQPRNRQRATSRKPVSPKVARKTAQVRKTAAGKTKQTKTYSRRVASDKENERESDSVEELSETSIIQSSEKLAAIKKKFEEVDAFELEFETVEDMTTSSSPFH